MYRLTELLYLSLDFLESSLKAKKAHRKADYSAKCIPCMINLDYFVLIASQIYCHDWITYKSNRKCSNTVFLGSKVVSE